MKYLIDTTENYRVDSEEEAKAVIEEAKRTSTVSKYNCQYKARKQKNEIIDEWYKVTITKHWTEEKEPDSSIKVIYKTESAWGDEENEN